MHQMAQEGVLWPSGGRWIEGTGNFKTRHAPAVLKSLLCGHMRVYVCARP